MVKLGLLKKWIDDAVKTYGEKADIYIDFPHKDILKDCEENLTYLDIFDVENRFIGYEKGKRKEVLILTVEV